MSNIETIKCKMCGSNIPATCTMRYQGYCDCIKAFTRWGTEDLERQGINVDEIRKEISSKTIKRDTKGIKDTKKRVKAVKVIKTGKKLKKIVKPTKERDVSKMKCYRCHFFGHLASDCNTKICDYCKGRRHITEQCKKNPDNYCGKCVYFGHKEEDCTTKICTDCGKKGHLSSDCWSNIMCEICETKGHPSDRCRINYEEYPEEVDSEYTEGAESIDKQSQEQSQ